MKSWKTTVAGVLAIATYTMSQIFGTEIPNVASWGEAIAIVTAGIGLAFARDNNKRSEDVGA